MRRGLIRQLRLVAFVGLFFVGIALVCSAIESDR